MPPPGSCMPPILTRRDPGSIIPPPPTIQQSLRSCRGLTVESLKADPNLREALRRLRAGMDDTVRATSAPPLIIKADEIGAIRGITAKQIQHDAEMRQQFRFLRNRTTHLQMLKDSRKFSAVGELSRGPPSPSRAAGKQTVASIGTGWLGPHRVMESYRRPTGPGKR